jgi:Tol biopolymer transport system component
MPRFMLKGGIALVLIVCTVFFPAACSQANNSQASLLSALKALGLKGKLIFVQVRDPSNQLVAMDLSDGSVHTLFNVPDRGYIGAADVSPDGKQIVMSYAPPPPGNNPQFGITDLYLLAADGSSLPKLLLKHQVDVEVFSNPIWSPDGQFIYYTHNIPVSGSTALTVELRVERIKPGGQPQILFHNAEWARLSSDGTQLAYLEAVGNGRNQIDVGSTDGNRAQAILPANLFPFVDSHFFSPDGKTIIFSAASGVNVGAGVQPDNQLAVAQVFGVTPVDAHTLPSDWYQVTLANGQVKRLAGVQDTNMAGTFSPDGNWIAFVSLKGVFVMKPDGSDLTQIASLMGTNSLSWVR